MCEATRRFTRRAAISLPTPIPGNAVSLVMIDEVLPTGGDELPGSGDRGEPTPKNPPIMIVAPSGIRATAASCVITVFIAVWVSNADRRGVSRVSWHCIDGPRSIPLARLQPPEPGPGSAASSAPRPSRRSTHGTRGPS